jgi:hypothetical protein
MRKQTLRMMLAAVAALTMMLAFVPAASADGTTAAHVAVFNGDAAVSPGLYFPGAGPPRASGDWGFTAPANPSSGNFAVGICQSNVGSCTLSLKGKLGEVVSSTGLGAYCGISRGHSGSGGGGLSLAGHTFGNVGWISSAGSILPVTGQTNGTTPLNTLVALVQASGSGLATSCATSGATSFGVIGVAAMF